MFYRQMTPPPKPCGQDEGDEDGLLGRRLGRALDGLVPARGRGRRRDGVDDGGGRVYLPGRGARAKLLASAVGTVLPGVPTQPSPAIETVALLRPVVPHHLEYDEQAEAV